MTRDADRALSVNELSLSFVSHRCARETERFFQNKSYDPRFCFEVFRRAAVDDSQRAWELAYKQYHALVHGWILRHPSFAACGMEPEDVKNAAFARLWKAVRGEKFERFSSLPSILQYLRMCVHSAIVDRVRKDRFKEFSLEADLPTGHIVDENPSPEDQVDHEAQRAEMWVYVKSRLQSDEEYMVIYDSYVLDLKPRQIYDRHSEVFSDVSDVYRIKQNFLARMRRDGNMTTFVEMDV